MCKLNISIDMGAINNGVFVTNKAGYKRGFNIKVGKNISYSMVNRRGKRSAKRANIRRKLSKRLIREIFGFDKLENREVELLNGLLNNRGYTFLSGEIEIEELSSKVFDLLNNLLNTSLNSIDDIEKFCSENSDSLNDILDKIKKLKFEIELFNKQKDIIKDLEDIKENNFKNDLKAFNLTLGLIDKKNIVFIDSQKSVTDTKKEWLKTNSDKLKIVNVNLDDLIKQVENLEDRKLEEVKTVISELKNTIDFIENIYSQINSGSKHRNKYIEEIENELEKKEYNFIEQKLGFNKDKFLNILLNIGNFQLKLLRKYFNDKYDDNFDDEKLYRKIKKHYYTHHYKSEKETETKKKLDNNFNEYKNTLTFLKDSDPKLTIPPYEDMNNRNTYKCNSLLIKETELKKELSNSINILKKEMPFSEVLNDDAKPSVKLQRILDINSKLFSKKDEIKHPRKTFKHQKGDYEYYKKLLSSNNYEEFKKLAERYYKEEQKAINGIFNERNSLFKLCNKNTPTKNNLKDKLIGHIWGVIVTKEQVDKLICKISNYETKIDKSKLKGFLEKKICEVAKEYQNAFFHNLVEVYNVNNSNDKNKIEDINKEHKELKTIFDNLEKLKNTFIDIFEELNINTYLTNELVFHVEKTSKKGNKYSDTTNLKRFVNSLKQTYEILFKDIHGFNKTCRTCTDENSFRSDESNPLAKRLLSDVAKPINGKLEKFLDRVAWEIVNNIDENIIKNSREININLEQNRFSFEKGLQDISVSKKDSKKLEKIKDRREAIDYNVCPYTGENFKLENCEYDHIISQSSSKNSNKQIYNSEANLIACSSNGNKTKGNKEYTLYDINPAHLKKVFNTIDIGEIKKYIIDEFDKEKSPLNPKNNRYRNFKNLTLDEKKAFRYALFFSKGDEYFNMAKELLATENKTTTNGTQKRLAKLIYNKLLKINQNIDANVKIVNSKIVNANRNVVADSCAKLDKKTGEITYNELKKPDNGKEQDSYSHIVDAMVVNMLANKQSVDEFFEIKVNKGDEEVVSVGKTPQWNEQLNNTKYKVDSSKIFDENDNGIGYLQLKIVNNKEVYKGVLKKSFVKSKLNIEELKYFKEINIIEKLGNNNYKINKNILFTYMFENKSEVIKEKSKFKKLDEELRYTYQKKDPLDFITPFLDPKTVDDKKALKAIIKRDGYISKDEINVENLMLYCNRNSKLKKSGAKLGYYKSWEIFVDILVKNKDLLFKEIEKENKDKEKYTILQLNKELALEKLKETLFKVTHSKKRKVKKVYTLYTASKNDTQFIIRRKNPLKSGYIYQMRLMDRDYKAKGFDKIDHYMFNNHKNVIPLKTDNYIKAFSNETSNS